MSGGFASDLDVDYLTARAEMHTTINCDLATLDRYHWNNQADAVALARVLRPRSLLTFTKSNLIIREPEEVVTIVNLSTELVL